MYIEEQYQKIILEIEKGSRALTRFSPEDREQLASELTTELEVPNSEKLEKLLCLIDHSASDDSRFEAPLLIALGKELSTRELIFTLNCCRKHILQARFKRGQRLDYHFLEALQRLLFSTSPEVVEWTLRTIEECGNQGVFFLKYFDKIKPAPWKWFNPHQRSVREIITMLERRWSRFEKEP